MLEHAPAVRPLPRPDRGARTTDRHHDDQPPLTILWLRRDLRLGDNPALVAAAETARERGGRLLPVYVWEPRERRAWAPGGAARWWLWHSLRSLDADLRRLGSRLLVERGDPVACVLELAEHAAAGAVVWAGGLEPDETRRRRDPGGGAAHARDRRPDRRRRRTCSPTR